MQARIRNNVLIFRIGLILLGMISLLIAHRWFPIQWRTVVFSVFILIVLIYNCIKVYQLKEVVLEDSGIVLKFPFQFKKRRISYRAIGSLKTGIKKGKGGGGAAHIDFPSFILVIETLENEQYILSTKENANLQQVAKALAQKCKLKITDY